MLDNPFSRELKLSGHEIRLSLSARRYDADRTIEVDARQLELRQELLALAKRTSALVIDPFGAVCSGNVCRVTDESGRPMYKDEGHFDPDWTTDHAGFMDAAFDR